MIAHASTTATVDSHACDTTYLSCGVTNVVRSQSVVRIARDRFPTSYVTFPRPALGSRSGLSVRKARCCSQHDRANEGGCRNSGCRIPTWHCEGPACTEARRMLENQQQKMLGCSIRACMHAVAARCDGHRHACGGTVCHDALMIQCVWH
jgi:hypothetical protein